MIDLLLATASDPRVAFEIGSLSIRWYGVIIVSAMVLGLIYACVECKRIGLTSDDAIELFLWIIPLAVIFCRIFYVFPGRIDEYLPWNSWNDFVNTIAIWDGGITIIGGIVGGVLAGIIFTIRHRKQVNFGQVADLVIVPLLLGQIIGRLGNFVNQEAFGLPITNEALQFFPFGVYITSPSGVSSEYWMIVNDWIRQGGGGNWFCATFFYEEVWNLICLVFCYLLWRKNSTKKYPGLLFIIYITWYCLGRFWLEYLRMDAVPITKIACIIIVPVGIVTIVLYLIARTSQLRYRYIKKLAQDNRLRGALITSKEVSNYLFVKKIVNSNNKLNVLYDKSVDFIDVDFASFDYYHVPDDYKKKFKSYKKEEFSL